jgi:hypothetical protein
MIHQTIAKMPAVILVLIDIMVTVAMCRTINDRTDLMATASITRYDSFIHFRLLRDGLGSVEQNFVGGGHITSTMSKLQESPNIGPLGQ